MRSPNVNREVWTVEKQREMKLVNRAQRAKVRPCRLLKNPQIKGGHNGKDVVENVGLNRLVVGPDYILAEDIDFEG